MYKSIIVPIDLFDADHGNSTIGIAERLADKGAKITVVNVMEDVPKRVEAELPEDIHDKIHEHARSDLNAMVKAAGVDADAEVRAGHPPTVIVELAKEKNADLIIVASHRPDWQDYLLGSTAARVVRHAKCSVLVVR